MICYTQLNNLEDAYSCVCWMGVTCWDLSCMRGWLSVSCDPGGEPTLTGSGVAVADGVHTASSG